MQCKTKDLIDTFRLFTNFCTEQCEEQYYYFTNHPHNQTRCSQCELTLTVLKKKAACPSCRGKQDAEDVCEV